MALNNHVENFTLDMAPGGIAPVLNVSQGDTGRAYTADMYWGGASYDVSGLTVHLRGRKGDNTVFDYALPAPNGTKVAFDLKDKEQVTIIPGNVECELVFTDSDSRVVGTANFVIIVEEAPYDPDAPSQSVITGIEDLIEEVLGGEVAPAVDEWLDAHPEATTTVQDGSITYAKLNDSLKAYVTPEMFGAVGDGTTDDTAAIQAAANAGGIIIFGKGKTYRIKASGFSSFNGVSINKKTIIYGNNSTLEVVDDTDYRSVIYATADFVAYDLNLYETNNNISAQTGTAEQNSRKTIWARHAACILNNVNISNAVGNHQLLVTNDGKPSTISNCTISFSENSEITYDSTMVYLEGDNITFENNVLNSNNNAHTAIETHGANIIVCNNRCINDFETGLYITNTAPAHNVVVKNNYLSCRQGITLWFEGSYAVGTVEIDNNIVDQTDGDYYVLNLYDVYNAVSVGCVLVSNNELRQSASTKQPIYFNPSRGNGGNIKKVVFENNYIICGSTNYVFELTSNNHSTVNFECFEIIRNVINCGGARPIHAVSSDGRVNNIIFSGNTCKNNGALGMANVTITTPQGFFDFIDNDFENPLTGLVNGNGTVNARVFGNVNIDLRAYSARGAKVANVSALNGDRLVTKGSRINKELSDTQKLTGSTIYTTGDIIWNSAPLIGQPIGWVSLDHDNFRPFGMINQS